MNKFLLLGFSTFVFLRIYAAGLEKHSQTFLFARPIYSNVAADRQLWHNFIYRKMGSIKGALQVMPMFSYSIPSDKLERYFTMNGKNVLRVDSNPDPNILKDIWGQWLDLPADVGNNIYFRGDMSFNPRQWQLGFVFEYNQDFKKIINHDFFKHFYVAVLIPIVYVNNNLNLTQTNVSNIGRLGIRDIIEAFRNSSWDYLRIRGAKSFVGIPEFKVKLGVSYKLEKDIEIAAYSFLLIPSRSKTNPKWMFDAVGGHDRHLGFGSGVNLQLPLNSEYSNYLFAVFMNIENVYLIKNKQYRTMDLKEKPYSRYMKFNRIDSNVINDVPLLHVNVPGVNVLTQKVTISPFNVVDASFGLRYAYNGFECEAGYNVWAHGDEELKLLKDWKHSWKPIYGIAGSAPGKTASKSDISYKADDDDKFIPIQVSDLDLSSASSREVLTHRVHGAIGYQHKGCKSGIFFGVGGFIEWPHQNSAFSQWGMWFKIGSVF